MTTHPDPAREEALCSDCPPVGYPTDETRCTPCPRRTSDEAPCTDCGGTGISGQTERRCACQPPLPSDREEAGKVTAVAYWTSRYPDYDGTWWDACRPEEKRHLAVAELAARTSDPMMHKGVDIIKRCAKRFREYERSHADKGTKEGDEKADRNADMAALCEQFIAKLEAQRT